MLSVQATVSDLSGLATEVLEDELAALASHLAAGMCRWLELVAELDRRGTLAEPTARWLAWRCAIDPRTAHEHVRVARRLEELPLIHAAFARGELSYTKVRALTRVTEHRFEEEELLELAFALTAAQLERALGAFRRVTERQAHVAEEDACLTWSWDDDGCLVLHGRLAPTQGALVLRALDAAKDVLWRQGCDEEGNCSAERWGIKNADALVVMAESQLAAAPGARSGGDRYQVVVHVEAESLAADEATGCQLEDGPALAAETVRRIACDCSLVTSVELDGEPLNVGRRRRTVPAALRRALARRDPRCRYPGCENRLFLDAHHVEHWAHGGETKLDNLVLLCRHHHRLLHEGRYRGETQADGSIVFYAPWGEPIPAVPRPPPGSLQCLLEDNQQFGIGANTCQGGLNEPLDLHAAVDALVAITSK